MEDGAIDSFLDDPRRDLHDVKNEEVPQVLTSLVRRSALSLPRVSDCILRMTHSTWLYGFGIFLIVCGLAGFLSNPAAAKTALISGSLFGGLSILWGLLLGKGLGFARWIALVMTILLCGVFGWRSTASWQAVSEGEPKAFAASLITLMLLGSIATVVKLLRRTAVPPQPSRISPS